MQLCRIVLVASKRSDWRRWRWGKCGNIGRKRNKENTRQRTDTVAIKMSWMMEVVRSLGPLDGLDRVDDTKLCIHHSADEYSCLGS